MDVHLAELAGRQHGHVARWQLLRLGMTHDRIDHLIVRGVLLLVHDGVYAVGHIPGTDASRWMAATLTAPGSVSSHASAGANFAFFRHRADFEVVSRVGSGGPRRHGDVLVMRTKTLRGDVTERHGIPITTGARTLLDLAPHVTAHRLERMTREALRSTATTPDELWTTLARHRGRRGSRTLRSCAERYCALPVHRARSDAEVVALELLHAMGRPAPRLNEVVAGFEADLIWDGPRVIIELDGAQGHRFTAADDADRDAAWRAAGYTVHRLPTDDVYDRPELLLTLAPGHPPR